VSAVARETHVVPGTCAGGVRALVPRRTLVDVCARRAGVVRPAAAVHSEHAGHACGGEHAAFRVDEGGHDARRRAGGERDGKEGGEAHSGGEGMIRAVRDARRYVGRTLGCGG
jgi:hypothetical protein